MDTALIQNGVVAQVWRDTDADELDAEAYTGDLVEFAPGVVVCGLLWNGSALSSAPLTAADLSLYTARKRRALTNGSATIDVGERSIPVWVDPESRGSITGLVVASGIVPNLTAPWKGADGEFYTLDAAEITALALGMMQFIQDCFTVEATVLAGIGNDTITTTGQIDAADWPG